MRSESELIALLKAAENPELNPNVASYQRDRVLAEILLDVRSLLVRVAEATEKKK